MITADEVRKLMQKLSVEEELKDIEKDILEEVNSNSRHLIRSFTYLKKIPYHKIDPDFVNDVIVQLERHGYRAEFVKPPMRNWYLSVGW